MGFLLLEALHQVLLLLSEDLLGELAELLVDQSRVVPTRESVNTLLNKDVFVNEYDMIESQRSRGGSGKRRRIWK